MKMYNRLAAAAVVLNGAYYLGELAIPAAAQLGLIAPGALANPLFPLAIGGLSVAALAISVDFAQRRFGTAGAKKAVDTVSRCFTRIAGIQSDEFRWTSVIATALLMGSVLRFAAGDTTIINGISGEGALAASSAVALLGYGAKAIAIGLGISREEQHTRKPDTSLTLRFTA
jgi:hypothetical protein